MIDHEQALDVEALGFGDAKQPWLRGAIDGMCGLLQHIFYSALKGEAWSVARLENAWDEIVGPEIDALLNGLPRQWDNSGEMIRGISSYLSDLSDHKLSAFDEVRRVLA